MPRTACDHVVSRSRVCARTEGMPIYVLYMNSNTLHRPVSLSVCLSVSPRDALPLGPVVTTTGVQGSSLLYNEFIVYDISQIKQRFVLQVKFHY